MVGIPKKIIPGDSYSWLEHLPQYPATEWAAVYIIKGGAGSLQVNAVNEGGAFRFNIGSTQSDDLLPGTNWFQLVVTKNAARHTVHNGTITVLVNLAATTGTVDLRHTYQKIIDILDAKIQGRVTKGFSQYTIGDKQLSMMSMKDLIEARRYYQTLLTNLNVQNKKQPFGTIKTRFTPVD